MVIFQFLTLFIKSNIMACKCKKEIAAGLTGSIWQERKEITFVSFNHELESNPDKVEIHNVYLQLHLKGQKKIETAVMKHLYCPFCGVPY